MPKISLRKPLTIVITVDALSASALGCYGCSWNETPAIDALSAEGILWDRWTSPTDHPGQLLRDWMENAIPSIRNFKGQSLLVTDDPNIGEQANAEAFDSAVICELASTENPASTIESTHAAKLFATAIDGLTSQTAFAWIHTSWLGRIWDAPIDSDHEDASLELQPPEEPDFEFTNEQQDLAVPFQLPVGTAVPDTTWNTSDDPDKLFAWTQRYAAQVRVLDETINILLASQSHRKISLVLAGTSGFALGQNGTIGYRTGSLRSVDIRLPLIINRQGPLRVGRLENANRFPELLSNLATRKPLVTPEHWAHIDSELQPSLETRSNRCHKAITTPGWFYVQESEDGIAGQEHLYLKPDDIDDVNDVARLKIDTIDMINQ